MRTMLIIALLCSSLLNAFGQENVEKLSSQQVRNLTAFTKAYGYVKYFHPSREALTTDWNDFAVIGVEKVLYAENDAQLISKLDSLFIPIGSSLQIVATKDLQETYPILKRKVQIWYHKGNGDNSVKYSTYKSKIIKGSLEELENKYNIPLQQPHLPELVEGISMVLPIAVSVKGNKSSRVKKEMKPYNVSDLPVRLAGIIRVWNDLQHFYPYWDVVEADWPKALTVALHNTLNDEDDLQYWDTLRELMAATQDGHGFVNITDYSGKWNGVGVWPTLIEDRLIVETLTKSSSEKIMLGDEIVSIEGKPALETLRREMDITAGSHQFKKRVALNTLLYSSSESDSMALTLLNKDGVAYQVNMPYLDSVWKKRKYLYEKIEEVEEGIYYISLDRIEDEDLQQALPELMKAEGIIFELKRYPNCSPEFLRYLTYKPIKSARWNVPKISYPDQLHLAEYDTSGRWTIYPAKQYLGSKKITFVISGRAISYAESLMGIIEHYQLGPIVGEEATAGTNGNVNRIELPGGFRVNYTGMKVLKHDGSQHHLIGIQPTHPVSITQQAIREGRDELIEEALAILKGEK